MGFALRNFGWRVQPLHDGKYLLDNSHWMDLAESLVDPMAIINPISNTISIKSAL